MEIRSIMCCCGQGLGSSMIVSMNVEKALKKLGVSGVKVEHTAIGEKEVLTCLSSEQTLHLR